ncbi:hypothetical protein VW35_04220 [Devosia soli]|uniref:Uncharacterized protein n=1 Tax=Devosia soli TaxID=361041 RepID=A0A0F5LBR5_9HYPH|nr:hypothetical protein VW35_04220 [Devosia soli]
MDIRASFVDAIEAPEPKRRESSSLLEMPELTGLDLPKILGIWKNAIRLSVSLDARRRQRGELALSKIEQEWKRRGLSALSSRDYFRWPSTGAPGGAGGFDLGDAPAAGVLSYLDYRVGQTRGEAPAIRQMILRRVFEGELPPVFPAEYLQQWGAKASAPRLQKLAESLASFCRNAKRRDRGNLADAIRDWESDLAYLHTHFYVAKFRFGWPNSRL